MKVIQMRNYSFASEYLNYVSISDIVKTKEKKINQNKFLSK